MEAHKCIEIELDGPADTDPVARHQIRSLSVASLGVREACCDCLVSDGGIQESRTGSVHLTPRRQNRASNLEAGFVSMPPVVLPRRRCATDFWPNLLGAGRRGSRGRYGNMNEVVCSTLTAGPTWFMPFT